MKKIHSIILLTIFGLVNLAQAQQYPYYYQYLMNRYSLSPSYGGVYGITEAYLGYRHNMINTDYGPRTLNFNVNAPLGKHAGMGATILNDKADIFNNLFVFASYSYHLQVAQGHFIDFGLSAGMNQKKLDLTNVYSHPLIDPNDPMFQGKSELKSTSIDFGGGLNYRWKGLNIGISTPSFYEVNNDFYEFKMHLIPFASYDFKIDTNWNIEPVVVLRSVEGAPINFDISAMARYKEKYWFGPTFRGNTIGALSAGGEIAKNLVMMYTYDFALPFDEYKGVLGADYGGHEINLGYRFGKRSGQPKDDEELRRELLKKARSGQVDSLAQQVNRLADSLARLKNTPDPTKDLKALEAQVRELNDKILTQTGLREEIISIAKTVYFVTGKSTITEYSKGKLDGLAAILLKYPSFNISIEGHTDSQGSDEYNQRLSEERARAVADYLELKGVDRGRMKWAGYGETRPVDTNETKEGRQKNRRTEIKAY